MTINECRRYLRRWRSTENTLKRLKEEKRTGDEAIEALRELSVTPPDGMPHGNKVTHPTEDTAMRILSLMQARQAYVDNLNERIAKAEVYLKRVELVMKVAEHSELLRLYYHDKKPMYRVAEELHYGKTRAWELEREAIQSICCLL